MGCPRCGSNDVSASGRCDGCGAVDLLLDRVAADSRDIAGSSFIRDTDRFYPADLPMRTPLGRRPSISQRGRAAGCRAIVRPSLPHHPRARRRRHGCRLSGVGCGARRRRRAEGHSSGGAPRSRIGRRSRAPVQAGAACWPAQVTHKHVVRIHDLGELDGIKYLTMPFVEGENLADVLQARGQAAGAAGARDREADRVGARRRRTKSASSIAT